jgi:hypothetical protein
MRLLFLLVVAFQISSCFGQNSPAFPVTNSNWVATDALGRITPDFKKTGTVKNEKWVGLFYYIWHGYHAPLDTIYDNTKILKSNPYSPEYGPRHLFHYWGEPEAGYYRSDDPWVIRRNIAMMAAAGVDFIYFDVTNAFTYLGTVDKYCEISLEMRSKGINAPYISFMTNSSGGATTNALYDEIYAKQRFKELWFYWEGKPLIFGNPADNVLRSEVKSFFNIKYSWAWTDAKNQPNHWQWIDTYPQDYGWSTSGKVDQMPVAVASHPVSNIGNSYSNGKQPVHDNQRLTPFTGKGLHFAEQWKQVFTLQPRVVMITQFNEWMAQRFICGLDQNADFLGVPAANGNTYFVDAYNEEYNRDIEPMKGGHTDNMYFQLVNYIRLFKGITAPEQASPAKKVEMDGLFTEWSNVKPVYVDYEGDTFHRNSKGSSTKTTFINNTGRNDLVESRVTHDESFVYFYAKTAQLLTSHSNQNWMMLYINTDTLKSTGWEGYDLLVNHNPVSTTQTTLKRFIGGTWGDENKINYAYAGNEIEIAVPVSWFKVANNQLVFSFHWSDNSQKLLDINEFFVNGDSAPDRRFDYLYVYENPNSVNILDYNKFYFYPNPAQNLLTLNFGIGDSYIIRFYDMASNLKIEKSMDGTSQQIDISSLAKGIYVIEAKSKYGISLVRKLVVI